MIAIKYVNDSVSIVKLNDKDPMHSMRSLMYRARIERNDTDLTRQDGIAVWTGQDAVQDNSVNYTLTMSCGEYAKHLYGPIIFTRLNEQDDPAGLTNDDVEMIITLLKDVPVVDNPHGKK